jgi:predicted Zn-dependent peptidase
VRIHWRSPPARTAALVQRVFDEIEFVRRTPLSTGQVSRIREALKRDFETDSQDNGYLLDQIAQRYEDGEGAGVALSLPDQIAALTGEAVQQAAKTYLNAENYVKVTLMPAAK